MACPAYREPATVLSDEVMTCSACQVPVLPTERRTHYQSDWHRYNVKRKCVSMAPISRELFLSKLSSMISGGESTKNLSARQRKTAENKRRKAHYDTLMANDQWHGLDGLKTDAPSSLLLYKCTLCSKTFKTHQQCTAHLATKKHHAKFLAYHKELRAKQQSEIDAFRATDAAADAPTMENLVPLSQLKPMLTIEDNPFVDIKRFSGRRNHRDANNDADRVEGNVDGDGNADGPIDRMQSEYGNANGSPAKRSKRVALPPTHDLFGDTEFETVDECLAFMMQTHGFFIPRPRRLTDLDALVSAAGKIIGERFQCVWCWKNHRSLKAVQAHMRAKGHCKLQMDSGPHWAWQESTDESPSPFLPFFDFEKELPPEGHGGVGDVLDVSDEEESKLDSLMIAEARERREITDINDAFELVRSDGTVIGHRDHALAYRQKHANLSGYRETQSEQQIIAQINNPMRKFKLMEMEKQKQKEQFEASGAKQQSVGDKGRDAEAMNAQTRAHKVSLQNWQNLQKSRQLAYN